MTKYLLLGARSDDEWFDGDINTCAVLADDLLHLARLGDYAADTNTKIRSILFDPSAELEELQHG